MFVCSWKNRTLTDQADNQLLVCMVRDEIEPCLRVRNVEPLPTLFPIHGEQWQVHLPTASSHCKAKCIHDAPSASGRQAVAQYIRWPGCLQSVPGTEPTGFRVSGGLSGIGLKSEQRASVYFC